MLRLIFLISLLALQVQATPFKRYSPGLKKDRQARTVFHIKATDGLNCSAFFIGPNGEALTNLHCLESCLVQAGAVTSEPFAGLTKNKVSIGAERPVSCSIEFSQGKKPENITIEILKVFGPGFMSPREKLPELFERSLDAYDQILFEGYEGWGDLALIRLPRTNSCVRISPVDFSRNQSIPVFGLSYPIVFRTPENPNPYNPEMLFTMGLTLLYSQGEATRNPEIFSKSMTPEEVNFIQRHLPEGTFLSSVDIEGGSSGSPIFDGNGDVIGVIRSTFNPSVTEFRAWMAEGVDLARHFSEILKWVPENANCLPSDQVLK